MREEARKLCAMAVKRHALKKAPFFTTFQGSCLMQAATTYLFESESQLEFYEQKSLHVDKSALHG